MLVEAGKRCIHHILCRHHNLARQVLHGTASLLPEWRRRCSRQHSLNGNARTFHFVLQRLRKVHDIRLGATVGAVQEVGRKGHNRGNVDQQTVLARHEARQRGKGRRVSAVTFK